MNAAVKTIKAHFGAESTCQLVIFTEADSTPLALPGVDHTNRSYSVTVSCPTEFSFPVKIHLVCLGDAFELTQLPTPPKSVSAEPRIFGNSLCPLEKVFYWTSDTKYGKNAAVQAVAQLTSTHYRPYKGALRYGSIRTDISLCPPPSVYSHTVTTDDHRPTLIFVLRRWGQQPIYPTSYQLWVLFPWMFYSAQQS